MIHRQRFEDCWEKVAEAAHKPGPLPHEEPPSIGPPPLEAEEGFQALNNALRMALAPLSVHPREGVRKAVRAWRRRHRACHSLKSLWEFAHKFLHWVYGHVDVLPPCASAAYETAAVPFRQVDALLARLTVVKTKGLNHSDRGENEG